MSAEITSNYQSILEMNPQEAKAFLLKQESYCNFPLPPYFDFDDVLKDIDAFLENSKFCDLKDSNPSNFDEINHLILNNKDGKYAWRPLQLIHPVLYVSLVHLLTSETNCAHIKAKFSEFATNESIRCLSIPINSLTNNKDRGQQIVLWWQEVEQKSIELALEYQYILKADITDCYGSIYTHSISWALHSKIEAKKQENRFNDQLVGVLIDKTLRDMSNGQTNGIPQGSVVTDFIAEMVLGYADLELTKKLEEMGIKEYKILRYRDDYRIFVNNPKVGERILKAITETMIELGMKLNPVKTMLSNQIVNNSVKEDKLSWMARKQSTKIIQKHLLIIHSHATNFPNSGSLTKALIDFKKKIENRKLEPNIVMPVISIAVDIAYNNPRVYPEITAILSKLVDSLESDDAKQSVIKKILTRFSNLPNTNHMEIWLQRISVKFDEEQPYKEPLCRLVAGEKVEIWNSEWISSNELKKLIRPDKIVDRRKIQTLAPVISGDEMNLFLQTY